jgi:hypothetical protein
LDLGFLNRGREGWQRASDRRAAGWRPFAVFPAGPADQILRTNVLGWQFEGGLINSPTIATINPAANVLRLAGGFLTILSISKSGPITPIRGWIDRFTHNRDDQSSRQRASAGWRFCPQSRRSSQPAAGFGWLARLSD